MIRSMESDYYSLKEAVMLYVNSTEELLFKRSSGVLVN